MIQISLTEGQRLRRADTLPVVAWGVDINAQTAIVFATTAAKARYIAVLSYWDAYGKRKGKWPPVTSWREPRFDKSMLLRSGEKGPFCRDYVEGYPCN